MKNNFLLIKILLSLICVTTIPINKILAQPFSAQVTGVQQIINGAITLPALEGMIATVSYFDPPGGVPKFMNLFAKMPSSTATGWVSMNVYLDTFPQTRNLKVGFSLASLGFADNIRVQSLLLGASFTDQPLLTPSSSINFISFTCALDSIFMFDQYDGNPAGIAGPPIQPIDFLADVTATVTRGCTVPNVELDDKNHPGKKGGYAGDHCACGPAAVANSLSWIENANPNVGKDGLEERQRLEELSALMKRVPNYGPTFDQILQGKISFIANHSLKLKVEFHHCSGNYQDDLDWLKAQYEAGQDVELDYSFFDSDNDSKAHIVVITGLTITGKVVQLSMKDDTNQKGPGGNDEDIVSGKENGSHHIGFIRNNHTCSVNNMYSESYDETAGKYTDPKTGQTSIAFCKSDPKSKKCVGVCPTIVSFYGADKKTIEAHPVCNASSCCDINVLLIGKCEKNGNCRGQCPTIFRSLTDAIRQSNGISGTCDPENDCACKYIVTGKYYRLSKPEDKLNRDQLSLYPNPATQEINIGVSDYEGKTEIILINMLGQKIISATINLHGEDIYTIDISNLSRGIYKVMLMNDGDVSSGTFVKEQ